MSQRQIEVLIVDDSPMIRKLLARIIEKDDEIKVIHTAANGQEALDRIHEKRPAIVLTDLQMPVMDGLELTRQIMQTDPLPILVVSSAVQKNDRVNVFNLLEAGALDVLPKPQSGNISDYSHIEDILIHKIKKLARVDHSPASPVATQTRTGGNSPNPVNATTVTRKQHSNSFSMVVIGSSTGGPQALVDLLSRLPADFSLPIVIVQHISKGFVTGLVEWMNNSISLPVSVARDNEVAKPGHVYLAPDGSHLEVSHGRALRLKDYPPKASHKPAVDYLFSSAANVFKERCIAVILTGMGRDGAEGIREIYQAGGYTLAQNQTSCIVFGMPRAAIELNVINEIHEPAKLAELIEKALKS